MSILFISPASLRDAARSSTIFLLTSEDGSGTLVTMSTAMEFLQQSQNTDGGWGYRVQGMSYIEPTAAVILALADGAERARGLSFLLSMQHADGGWGIAAMDAESGWMTAWAVRALAQFPDARPAATRGAQWLIQTEGLRVTDAPTRAIIYESLQINSTLLGWPWQPGDAAWVHPTALAMLALSAVGKSNDARVGAGLAYLLDRVVASGGWNVGNPMMLGKQVPATIQDTAITLLALRAFGTSASDVRVSAALGFLNDAMTRAKTAAELAWGIHALHDWGIDAGDAGARMNTLQSDAGGWMGNPFITAIALLASQGPR